MPGTFNTSDFDEEEYDDDYDDYDDYDEDYDGLGEDIGDGYGEDITDPLAYEDDPFGENSNNKKSEKRKNRKEKRQEKNQNLKTNKLTVKGKTKQKFSVTLARKDAIAKIMSPAVEGICPFCHKRSIHKSYRPMDLLIFTGISALLTAGGGRISTFYCMNKKCKFSYWKNYCFRCGGDRWVGAKAPWKRIAGVDM